MEVLAVILGMLIAPAHAVEVYICNVQYLDGGESYGCVKVPDEDQKEEETVKVHYAESDFENERHGNDDYIKRSSLWPTP